MITHLRRATRAAAILLTLGMSAEARAVSLTIAGPSSGPITSGTGLELIPTPASQVTITFGLNVATSINGYDVTIAWDPTEVSLAGDTQLFPSGMPPDTLTFTVAADPMSSAGTRVATISLTAFTTGSLFSLTFDVGALVQDGAPDVRVFVDAATNGAGLAPGSLVLENDSGAGIDLAPATAVPEPATIGLALSGLTFLFVRRRRRAGPRARAPCLFRCLTAFLALLLLTSSSLTANATTPDADGDVVPDYCDNCRTLPNRGQLNAGSDDSDSCVIPTGQMTGACKAKPGVACKEDIDCALPVTGDACDCDFDDDGDCDADDYGNAFLPDFTIGMSLTAGTDMDGSGTVNIDDFNLFLMGHASGAPGPGATAANAVNKDAAGILSMGACWNERVGPLFASASDGCSLSPATLAPLGFPADGNVNNPADAVLSSATFGLIRCPSTSFGTFEKPGAVCGIDVDVSNCAPERAGLPCGPDFYCRVFPSQTCATDADCTTAGTGCFVGHCNPDPPKSCLEDVDCGTGFKCVEMFCGDVHHPRPCEKHDDIICGYRGIEKNNQFRRDLFAVCNALTGVERDACYAVCLVYAKAYADAIDSAGDDDGVWSQPELDFQRRACDCCQDRGPAGEPPPVCGDGRCDEWAESCEVGSCPEDCGSCGVGDACHVDADCPGRACLPDGKCGRLPAFSACQTNSMCRSGSCVAGTCVQGCGDGYCDGTEFCGASDFLLQCNADCGRCAPGQFCLTDSDCANNACNFNACIGVKLPGGAGCSTNNACLSGACNFGFCLDTPLPALSPCTTGAACKSGSCPAGLCAQICNDGFCDGLEKCGDVNGGLECIDDCGKCGTGEICTSNGDCTSGICNVGFCIATPLPALSPCTTGAACKSGSCPAGFCAQICGDGFCDGTEQCGNVNAGIECNADCSTCGNGHLCTQNADCTSGACNIGFCVGAGSVGVGGACTTAAACSNGICEVLCCGRPFTSGCTQNSDCCSNNCASFLGVKSCALFGSAAQAGSSETGSTGEGTKKKPAPKKTKPAKGTKKP